MVKLIGLILIGLAVFMLAGNVAFNFNILGNSAGFYMSMKVLVGLLGLGLLIKG